MHLLNLRIDLHVDARDLTDRQRCCGHNLQAVVLNGWRELFQS